MLLRPAPSSRQQANCRHKNGLSVAELLWAVTLLALVGALIVKTLTPERERARISHAASSLEYLRGHIHLALEDATLAGKFAPDMIAEGIWLGPGAPPKGIDISNRESLHIENLVHPATFLPTDPWGHAYVLRSLPHHDRQILTIATGGPDGILPESWSANSKDILQILWPRP